MSIKDRGGGRHGESYIKTHEVEDILSGELNWLEYLYGDLLPNGKWAHEKLKQMIEAGLTLEDFGAESFKEDMSCLLAGNRVGITVADFLKWCTRLLQVPSKSARKSELEAVGNAVGTQRRKTEFTKALNSLIDLKLGRK